MLGELTIKEWEQNMGRSKCGPGMTWAFKDWAKKSITMWIKKRSLGSMLSCWGYKPATLNFMFMLIYECYWPLKTDGFMQQTNRDISGPVAPTWDVATLLDTVHHCFGGWADRRRVASRFGNSDPISPDTSPRLHQYGWLTHSIPIHTDGSANYDLIYLYNV